jgi:hypothetical protein
MKLLVISGGRHPYAESTPVLEGFLKAAGHEVTVTEEASVLADSAAMSGYDVLVFNTRRENLPDFGDLALSKNEQQGLSNFIRSARALFVSIFQLVCQTLGPNTTRLPGVAGSPAPVSIRPMVSSPSTLRTPNIPE